MKLTDHFRPRADAHTLSTQLQAAWAAEQRKLTDQCAALGVSEAVAAHLEARYPAADMAILKRYGVAKEIESIGVRTYSPETACWDEVVSVQLPRPVLTPGAYGKGEVYVGGPRWSREPDRGLTAEYRAKLTPEDWAAHCEDQDDREAARLPEAVEPYFAAVAAARKAYRAEYRVVTDWPAQRKAETGAYPTWAEIAARFPDVLGAYLIKELFTCS